MTGAGDDDVARARQRLGQELGPFEEVGLLELAGRDDGWNIEPGQGIRIAFERIGCLGRAGGGGLQLEGAALHRGQPVPQVSGAPGSVHVSRTAAMAASRSSRSSAFSSVSQAASS